MSEFSSAEQAILDELVRRRSTSFKRPPWMQSYRARAIKAEARRIVGEMPDLSADRVRRRDRVYYEAERRVQPRSERGRHYKIHEAGPDGRPVCTMHRDGDWKPEYLDAGPVTCGKCASTRSA